MRSLTLNHRGSPSVRARDGHAEVSLPWILPFHVLNEIAMLGNTVTSADLHR
jgi:hypothetical protein